MRGTAEDEQQAVKLRSKINGDYVWFRQDGKSYYTADQAIVTQVRNLFQPMAEVSQKEAMLGQEKAKLSAEKEKLSDLKTELLGHPNTMRPEQVREQLGVLRDRISRLRGKEASETELQDLEQRIQELQAGLGQSREAAYSRLADLSRQQSALSDQQSEIGARQLALSAEKERLSEQTAAKVRVLLGDLLGKKLVQPGRIKPRNQAAAHSCFRNCPMVD